MTVHNINIYVQIDHHYLLMFVATICSLFREHFQVSMYYNMRLFPYMLDDCDYNLGGGHYLVDWEVAGKDLE